MQTTDNTVLITGGTSGIGRALAEAFHREGNQVIIAGRRKRLLDEVAQANPGMRSAVLDIQDGNAIRSFGRQIVSEFPKLNVVIQNAGIMKSEDLKSDSVADAEATIETNLLGPIRLTAALIGHLLQQPRATIMTVTSGLAFAPLAMSPTYCATKAAIHSYTQSLRYQLKDTRVEVIELIPPYVQTELMGPQQATDPTAMPLKDFIAEPMSILRSTHDAKEICVERVKAQRFAERNGNYDEFFRHFNEVIVARRSR